MSLCLTVCSLIYRVTSSFMLGVFFAISVGISETAYYTGCEVLNSRPGLQSEFTRAGWANGQYVDPVTKSLGANGTSFPSRDLTVNSVFFPICRVACKKSDVNTKQMQEFDKLFGFDESQPGYYPGIGCPSYLIQPNQMNDQATSTFGRVTVDSNRGTDGILAHREFWLNGTTGPGTATQSFSDLMALYPSGLTPGNIQEIEAGGAKFNPLSSIEYVANLQYENWRGQMQGDIQSHWYRYSGQVAS